MKHIKTSILIAIASIATLCGCTQIKGWFNSADFTTVASVIAPSLETAAQYTVNAVCKKNPDLTNIFKVSGNGILISVNASDYSTEEIEKYIKQGLGDNVNTWWPLIETSMQTMLSWYDAIYTKFFDIEDNTCLQGFNLILTGLANGVIKGAEMSTAASASKVASEAYVQVKAKEIAAVNELRETCSQFGICIE